MMDEAMTDTELNTEKSGWVEGTIDQAKPFFVFIAGSMPAALLGQSDSHFVVQRLCDGQVIQSAVTQKLDFFLNRRGTEVQQMGRWGYMIHFALVSASNFYSHVHLQYVEPPTTMEQAIRIWQTRSGEISTK